MPEPRKRSDRGQKALFTRAERKAFYMLLTDPRGWPRDPDLAEACASALAKLRREFG